MSSSHHPVESLAAKRLEIDEVLDLRSGAILDASAVIGSDKEKAFQLRMALVEGIIAGQPLLACPLCRVPVRLLGQKEDKAFYFRHEIEDGRCPAKTKGELSPARILAMKYNGVRESEAHKRMKAIIAQSLEADPDFANVEIEPVWKGEARNERRQPDVRATWRGQLPVAFEVQLSTTFLQVIAERRDFYLRHGGLLFWVFKDFDHGKARMTHEDIFYNNNRNAFVVSEETLQASRAAGALTLDCIWSEPAIDTGEMLWTPRQARCSFADLTKDPATQRVFLFDADAARARCEARVVDQPLRNAFRAYWMSERREQADWQRLRTRLLDKGIRLPEYTSQADGLEPLIDTLYSAEAGEPVAGWGHGNLVVLAHHIHTRYKGFLWAFRLMLLAHRQFDVMEKHDPKKRWKAKADDYKAAWRRGDPDFAPDRRYDRLVSLLFPEIAQRLAQDPA